MNITVSTTIVASLTLTPDSTSVLVHDSTQFTASTFDALGLQLSNRVIQWSSLNETVAPVNNDGRAQVVAAGPTPVVATSDGKPDPSTLLV